MNTATDLKPGPDGRHPGIGCLVWGEFEAHHGSYILTVPGQPGDVLLSEEDARHCLGDAWGDESGDQEGWIVDDYLALLNAD